MRDKLVPFYLSALLLIGAASSAGAAESAAIPATPFTRGINLSGWFEVPSPRQIQFTRYTRKDFESLKALGCDVIRLPINLKAMTSGSPDYTLDPLFLSFLDEAIGWAEDLGIYIIVDNHTFDPAIPTESDVEKVLLKEWTQLAARYRDRSDFVVFEVLNEPHGIDVGKWAKIQGRVVAAIRAIDARHAIIVGSANFNNYRDLVSLPAYPEKNLIYTFHFYDPMVFTHQGAAWTAPSLATLSGVPFPPDSTRMPAVPAKLKGTWIENDLKAYSSIAAPERLEEALDIPARFAVERKVPVFCGELGVYIPNAPSSDRVAWHRLVRAAFEKRGFSWAIWDAYGSFGLFNSARGGSIEHDLNVPLVTALGMTAPVQTPFVQGPETKGIDIFRDYPGAGIVTWSYGAKGSADFYSTDAPSPRKYALRWGGCDRYGSVAFNFTRPLDLSTLAETGYALEFTARTDKPGSAIEIRFRNAVGAPGERPWRMSRTLDETLLPADGAWHRVRIPLSEMRETGAWDDAWFDPSGLFSWKRVSVLEFVAEGQALAGVEYSFADIAIAK